MDNVDSLLLVCMPKPSQGWNETLFSEHAGLGPNNRERMECAGVKLTLLVSNHTWDHLSTHWQWYEQTFISFCILLSNSAFALKYLINPWHSSSSPILGSLHTWRRQENDLVEGELYITLYFIESVFSFPFQSRTAYKPMQTKTWHNKYSTWFWEDLNLGIPEVIQQ